MGDYFKYYPLELKGFEKFFFRPITFSVKVILIFSGIALFASRIYFFKVLGFWLALIFIVEFLKSKFWSKADTRSDKSRNLADYFNLETLDLIFDTFKDLENANVGPPQVILLLKLQSVGNVKNILKKLNINTKDFQTETSSLVEIKKNFTEIDLRKTPDYLIKENLLPVFIRAKKIAKSLFLPNVSCEVLFAALSESENFEIAEIFNKFKLTPELVISATVDVVFKEKPLYASPVQELAKFIKPFRGTGLRFKKPFAPQTPFLDRYGINLTYLAKRGKLGFLIGHQKEIGEISTIFNRSLKTNTLLFGDSGIGKNSIIYNVSWLAANDIIAEKTPYSKIIQINLADFHLNSQEFTTILNRVLNESLNAGDVILYFSEIQNVLSVENLTLFTTLKPFLSSGLPVIFTTTPVFLQKINQIPEVKKYFKIIAVDEISEIEAISILTLEAKCLWKNYRISITPQAVICLAALSKKYFPEEILLSSARKTLKHSFDFAKKEKIQTITEEMIGDIIAKTSIKI